MVYPQLTHFSVIKGFSDQNLYSNLIWTIPKIFKMLESTTAPSKVPMNSQLSELIVCREAEKLPRLET